MKVSTLCFCIKGEEVLLAMKKRGFGTGKWNGYGGKIHEGESPQAAASREIEEESGLVVDEAKLHHVALVHFSFDEILIFSCYVFLTYQWQGDPVETGEMRPQWYPISNLPFGEMWVADAQWIPLILAGEKIEAQVNFNADGSSVKEFSYKVLKLT